MFGQNPKRKPENHSGEHLYVQSIFPTLQGEGPYVGWPAVFVRLGGCNLACDFCDTEFEDFQQQSIVSIVDQVMQLSIRGQRRHSDLVVLTGGEPFRQEIAPLCDLLIEHDYLVQIETNGTLFRGIPYGVDIICSPKPVRGRYAPLRDDLAERVSALKFLISTDKEGYTDVPELGQNRRNIPVYVQPMDEYDALKNKANQQAALKLALQRGYRLSLQTHKILGIE
ncbi:MAG: radical SAM protein [Rickettsiales bacterium]|nr:radical SAM protein [Rickettsiales bacterium]|tara:strand:+ start:67 stop:741 length:675 start_codon:yes stop_codon:yes gene_type:complete